MQTDSNTEVAYTQYTKPIDVLKRATALETSCRSHRCVEKCQCILQASQFNKTVLLSGEGGGGGEGCSMR